MGKESAFASNQTSELQVPPFVERLESLLPIEELTTASLATGESAFLDSFGKTSLWELGRALNRQRKGHVVLTGDRGVGKTTLVRRFAFDANHAARSSGQPLRRYFLIDVSNVGPEDSRACLEIIVSSLTQCSDATICLDGFATLFPRPSGGSNKPLIRTMLNRLHPRIIGIMTDLEYAELIGGDAQMLPLVTRVRLDEPTEEAAIKIAVSNGRMLEERFGIAIPSTVAERAVTLSSTFLLNQRHPSKAIGVLWHACENRAFARQSEPAATDAILAEQDLVEAVAELTDLPAATISGEGAACDFETALGQAVVGQEEAVREVATELRLITSGLTEPDKPASVMMFAGTTGVGKSELAKRIAELYASSRKVNVYSMGNFTESHSVSGLVGVPPGYVGHEQGGRLVNDLNADPYCVFLLDEAEKCHPNVWKPFLHLFDEGWIVDQRGVKAYADKAIFILTTNAGDRQISQLVQSGKPIDEIGEQVRKALARVRQERSSQVVFPPQFLARIKRIVLFRPLDSTAMLGIAERIARRVQRIWRMRQRKELILAAEVLQSVAQRAHELNEKAEGQEGGRIVRKLFADLIERTIQEEATTQVAEFKACEQICIESADNGFRVRFVS